MKNYSFKFCNLDFIAKRKEKAIIASHRDYIVLDLKKKKDQFNIIICLGIMGREKILDIV